MIQVVDFDRFINQALYGIQAWPDLPTTISTDLNLFFSEMQRRDLFDVLDHVQLDFIEHDDNRTSIYYYYDWILLTQSLTCLSIDDYLRLMDRVEQIQQKANAYGIKINCVLGEPGEDDSRITVLLISFDFEGITYCNGCWDVSYTNQRGAEEMIYLDSLDDWLNNMILELNEQ